MSRESDMVCNFKRLVGFSCRFFCCIFYCLLYLLLVELLFPRSKLFARCASSLLDGTHPARCCLPDCTSDFNCAWVSQWM